MAKAKKQAQIKRALLEDSTSFAVRESYGMLRTNILYMPCDDDARVIAITSAEESSGKSTIIANLALSFARMGKKVVLIDADMRCPKQHQFFKYEKDRCGLSEYLAGISSKKEALQKNAYESLDIISCGHLPPSPAELVLSARFPQLMSELKAEYDFVFIDFPPIGIVSDAAAVANCITGYIFVIRANHSDSLHVKHSIEKLEQVDANILGIVFNDVNFKSGGYGHYGHYGHYGRSHYENSKYERSDRKVHQSQAAKAPETKTK